MQAAARPTAKPKQRLPAGAGIVGYKGERLTLSEWRDITQGGCFGCQEPLNPEDAEDIRWLNKDQAYCPMCDAVGKKAVEQQKRLH